MSRPFVAAAEEAFAGQARFQHAIVYDSGQPVACGSLCAFTVDLNVLSDGPTRRMTEILGRLVPSAIKKRVILCGLPVSVGAKHLAIAPGAPDAHILRALHQIATSFAKRERAQFILFKEFPEEDCPTMDLLRQFGYQRFASPPMNGFDRRFPSFDAYLAALRSRYRQCVRKSLNKSRAAALRYERLTDTDAILRLYTPSLHRLYEAVALSSDSRLELLPVSFFHALARRMPGQVGLTAVFDGDRVVAFNWNLLDEGSYHFLFAGLDYERNPEMDLYFNVMYAEMDFAFRAGATSLVFGQTADDFKVRLGCTQEGRFFYLAPVGISASLILRFAGDRLFPEPPPAPVHHPFPSSDSVRTTA
jgi:hypothetical protein